MIKNLYNSRFKIFFLCQLMMIIVPLLVFSYNIILSPWLLLCNLIAGILIVKEKKNQMWFLISLLGILIISFVLSNLDFGISKNLNILKISIYLIFFLIVYIETTKQVWKASLINNNIVY